MSYRYAVQAFALVTLLSASLGAQGNPESGGHTAARASDTGYQTQVNSTGAFGASVPLSFPGARGGLPVPLSVVYGGNQVGAAGVGWDVPISYILRSDTEAHRRPVMHADGSVAPPVRWSLILGGSSIDLVRNAEDTAWVGRRNAQMEVRSDGEGRMVMTDGAGLTYEFSSAAGGGARLVRGTLFLLKRISSAENTVELEYTISQPALPGGGTGLGINLTRLSYNRHKTNASCFKHKISLVYDVASPTPLSMRTLNGAIVTRSNLLSAISVASKPTCATETTLSTYRLSYGNSELGVTQLQSVTMTGRKGTPEQNVTLPVAEYGYGKYLTDGYKLQFEEVSGGPPAHGFWYWYGMGYTRREPSDFARKYSKVRQFLRDMDGDGIVDFANNWSQTSYLRLYRGRPTPSGPPEYDYASWLNQDLGTTATLPIDTSNNPSFRKTAVMSLIDQSSLVVDFNGDGMMNLLDDLQLRADSTYGFYYQQGQITNEYLSWRSLDADALVHALDSRPFGADHYTRSFHRDLQFGYSPDKRCTEAGGDNPLPGELCAGLLAEDLTRVITDYDLFDVNGDGYPDFVYNDANLAPNPFTYLSPEYLGFVAYEPVSCDNGPCVRPWRGETASGDFIPAPSERPVGVRALLNQAGRVFGETPAFSPEPVQLEAAVPGGCGVRRLAAASWDEGVRVEVCGFHDVNGDGIVDRTRRLENGQYVAFLGTGDMSNPYPGGFIVLPGPPAETYRKLVPEGAAGSLVPQCSNWVDYPVDTNRVLRDFNGDGIPDYISWNGGYIDRIIRVQFGTGVGFTVGTEFQLPMQVLDEGSPLSRDRVRCYDAHPGDDEVAANVRGMYDLDGDGQLEFVENSQSTSSWKVYRLKSNPQPGIGSVIGRPEAGRLVSIQDGYGAKTEIAYQSAKQDGTTAHQVPFREIVVAAVTTTGAGGEALATTRYAYGGAEMMFDPISDGFVFAGYRRRVVQTIDPQTHLGSATVTDTFGLGPYHTGMSAQELQTRLYRVGRPSTVTTLASALNPDPMSLLADDLDVNPKVVGRTEYEWDVRPLAGSQPAEDVACSDNVYPYAPGRRYNDSQLVGRDPCSERGVLFARSVVSSRVAGDVGVSTAQVVETVDELGRVTRVWDAGDVNRTDDDLCTQTAYATPQAGSRILGAPAVRTTYDCEHEQPLAETKYEYDGLAVGLVGLGNLTSQIVSRRDAETGNPISNSEGESDIRVFQAEYDSVGNPTRTLRTREDGATQTTTVQYDEFGLVATGITSAATEPDGTALPPLVATLTVDTATLQTTGATDAHGTTHGAVYDGFGRDRQATVTLPGGTVGVVSTTSYAGFALGEAGGRRVTVKEFSDPVSASAVNTMPGQVGTTYLDALGRVDRTEVVLGSDYPGKTLVMGKRRYDSLGRVIFSAAPYPLGDDFQTAYGTSVLYNADNRVKCTIDGTGYQTNPTQDLASERFPTCYTRTYNSDGTETVRVQDATGEEVDGAADREVTVTALGRVLEDRRAGRERSTYEYDRLGNPTRMTRYLTVHHQGEQVTRWHYDSLGQVIEFEEPDTAVQHFGYTNWGELTQVEWQDSTVGAGSSRRVAYQYDARGRMTQSADEVGGVIDADSVRSFTYDVGVASSTPPLVPTNVLGRLASATSATSSVSFSYDGLGNVDAQSFVDTTVTPGVSYQQRMTTGVDGTLRNFELRLPDTGYQPERANYDYDTAGRLRGVTYNDGVARTLYAARGVNDIDIFGRVRNAQYGKATLTTDYAAGGRQMIQRTKVASPAPLVTSREIAFPDAFDRRGHERSRTEYVDGAQVFRNDYQYDSLGRLASATRQQGWPVLIGGSLQYQYDSLGNITSTVDWYSGSGVAMQYQSIDKDRLCNIDYAFGTAPWPTECAVKHDAMGNVLEMPTEDGGLRTLTYFAGGLTKSIDNGATHAVLAYDAFGDLQQLHVESDLDTQVRAEKHFGPNLTLRQENGVQVLNRRIPGPSEATRHGANGPWTYALHEDRGGRFVLDQEGAFVQDIEYTPFGGISNASGAEPGTTNYLSQQWNAGESLVGLGVSQLGARIYDPTLGRFLSRDPLLLPRGGSGTNPYAFAYNDPINFSDPTGLCGEAEGIPCPEPIILPGGGGGGTPPPPPPGSPYDPCDGWCYEVPEKGVTIGPTKQKEDGPVEDHRGALTLDG
ncbi:MAG: RHS repeat-associated core domain-containing protein [Polyangiaceae bacterium]